MTNRQARVTELISRELSTILARDHSFPDVLVTVTDVDLTPDFKNAHIFIGVIGSEAKQQNVIEKLNAMRGVLSSRVAKRVVLKNMPHFFFKLDHSVERGVRVTALMEQIDQQLLESARLNPEPEPVQDPVAGPLPDAAAAAVARVPQTDGPMEEEPSEIAEEEPEAAGETQSPSDRPLRRRNR